MLTRLSEIMEQVASSPRLEDALSVLVDSTSDAMQVACCSVYILNTDSNVLDLIASHGLEFSDRNIAMHCGEGLVGNVAEHEQTINLANASEHPDFQLISDIGEEAFISFLGVPIIYQKSVLGVLVLQDTNERKFTEADVSFVMTLATQLAIVLSLAQSQGRWSSQRGGLAYHGVPAARGVAVAKAWWDDSHPDLAHVSYEKSEDTKADYERLCRALNLAENEFRRVKHHFTSELDNESLEIFDFLTHLVNDPMVKKELFTRVEAGDTPEWAVKKMVELYSAQFAQMSDPYLKQRAGDVHELGQQLLRFLHNQEMVDKEREWKQPIVLLVRELTASILADIPRDKLAGIVTQQGAVNAHASILARALGIPTVAGIEFQPKKVVGKTVVVDGYQGDFLVQPGRHVIARYRRLRREEKALDETVAQELALDAITEDGEQIEILLNADLSGNLTQEITESVDGVGLYRTEIPFLLQHSFPSEFEQCRQYTSLINLFPNKKVVMRTLDVGGDKALPYITIEEDNPFLGWRGIRFTQDYPDIFIAQVRAMLRASFNKSAVDIMLPMVSDIDELDSAIDLIEEAYWQMHDKATQEDVALQRPRLGVMVEVPSMLFLLPALQDRVDFISVGSNDLTQYLLAVDRNNAKVANVYQPLHPSVIQSLDLIINQCRRYDIEVSVCGELAGDPLGAMVLVGLGYRSLSMNRRNIAKIKYMLRRLSVSDLEEISRTVLSCFSVRDVKTNLEHYLISKGLDAFVRKPRA